MIFLCIESAVTIYRQNQTSSSEQLFAASSQMSLIQFLVYCRILSHTFSTVTLIYRFTQVRILTRIPAFDSGLWSSIMQDILNNFPCFRELFAALAYFYPYLLMQSYQWPEGLVVLMLVYFKYVKSLGSSIPTLLKQMYFKLRLGCKVSISLYSLINLLLSLGCIFLLIISLQQAYEQGISYSMMKQFATEVLHARSLGLLILSFDYWTLSPGLIETSVQFWFTSKSSAALQAFYFKS